MAGESIAAILTEARQLLAEKKCDEAVERLQAVLQEEPEDADILSLLGAAHAENRDYPQAVAYFDKALKIKPNARGHFNIASLYKMQGDKTQAISALKEALKLDPSYTRATQMLAELGVTQEAVDDTPVMSTPTPAQPQPTPVSQFGAVPPHQSPPQTPSTAYGTQTSPIGKPQGQQNHFQPDSATQTVIVRHWPKIIGGGIMVGIPYLLLSLAWGSTFSAFSNIFVGLLLGFALMGVFFKWLSNSAGAYESQHWILMILLTGLIPSLLVIKGFDLIAAGWYNTERRFV